MIFTVIQRKMGFKTDINMVLISKFTTNTLFKVIQVLFSDP